VVQRRGDAGEEPGCGRASTLCTRALLALPLLTQRRLWQVGAEDPSSAEQDFQDVYASLPSAAISIPGLSNSTRKALSGSTSPPDYGLSSSPQGISPEEEAALEDVSHLYSVCRLRGLRLPSRCVLVALLRTLSCAVCAVA
jgi:hypothetical protein